MTFWALPATFLALSVAQKVCDVSKYAGCTPEDCANGIKVAFGTGGEVSLSLASEHRGTAAV